MGTTLNGYPYPEPTMPVRDGAVNIRALAEWDQRQTPWAIRCINAGATTDVNGLFWIRYADLTVSGVVCNLWNLGAQLGWRVMVNSMEGPAPGQLSAAVMQVVQANGAPAGNTAIAFYAISFGTSG